MKSLIALVLIVNMLNLPFSSAETYNRELSHKQVLTATGAGASLATGFIVTMIGIGTALKADVGLARHARQLVVELDKVELGIENSESSTHLTNLKARRAKLVSDLLSIDATSNIKAATEVERLGLIRQAAGSMDSRASAGVSITGIGIGMLVLGAVLVVSVVAGSEDEQPAELSQAELYERISAQGQDPDAVVSAAILDYAHKQQLLDDAG
jgi:hypothetical protein